VTLQLSVITCAHNPRPDYLRRVLEALDSQTLDKERWEYLLIDNDSSQPLAQRTDLSWHPQARHIREEQLGLTPARLCGIREAKGEILLFVDDDNVLDSDYLEQAVNIAAHWPMIGAFSGQVRPGFEKQPPAWTKKYWNRLAIREFDEDRWSNIPCLEHTTPNGAGLCVRRRVADEYARYHADGKRKFMLDRTGTRLLSAGDLDLATTACDLGLGNGVFAALKLTHQMPAERLDEGYLLRLLEDQTFSAVVLASFRSNGANGKSSHRRRLRTFVADQARFLRMNPRDRRFFRAARNGERKALDFLSNGLVNS
jgi:glycosyltransferase involved in cell wall biosynthesis